MDRAGILFLVFLLLLAGLASAGVHSFDIFWQLQSGRHILETGSFIYEDIFSLASQAPRYEHCWLHDIIFYGVWGIGGYAAVSLLKGVIVAATAAFLAAAARVRSSSWLAILLVAPAPLLMTFWSWKARPQLWTFLLFSVFIFLLERHRLKRDRGIYLAIPLMVLWANLHAGAILAFPIWAAYLAAGAGAFFTGRAQHGFKDWYSRLWWGVGGLLLAACATPYGGRIFRSLIEAPQSGTDSGKVTQAFNIDWALTTFSSYPAYYYAMAMALTLLVLGWRKASAGDLVLLGGLAFMGMTLERHTPFFFFAVAALLPRYADYVGALVGERLPAAVPLRFARLVVLALALGAAVYTGLPAYRDYGLFDTGLRAWHYPVEEARFVRQEQLPGNLFNPYGAGGYLMWSLYPDYRVFWDGRQDSPEMFALGLRVSRGMPDWRQILDRFEVDTVIAEACSQVDGHLYPLVERLRVSEDWALVRAGEAYLVYVRENAVDSTWLARYRLPERRVDDTILSAARHLSQVSPLRRGVYWEMARVYARRHEYVKALGFMKHYLQVTPEGRRRPDAESVYRQLQHLAKNGNRS